MPSCAFTSVEIVLLPHFNVFFPMVVAVPLFDAFTSIVIVSAFLTSWHVLPVVPLVHVLSAFPSIVIALIPATLSNTATSFDTSVGEKVVTSLVFVTVHVEDVAFQLPDEALHSVSFSSVIIVSVAVPAI